MFRRVCLAVSIMAVGACAAGAQTLSPKWEELTAETEFDKIRKGYPVDAPLLRNGQMRNSIETTVIGNEAVVGSNDQKMVWHELGTRTIPPRAVLGPAAIRAGKDIQARFGRTVAAWLAGWSWRNPRLK